MTDHDPEFGTVGVQFACMDPDAVAARRAWIAAGKPGHYPGCPCDSCTARRKAQP